MERERETESEKGERKKEPALLVQPWAAGFAGRCVTRSAETVIAECCASGLARVLRSGILTNCKPGYSLTGVIVCDAVGGTEISCLGTRCTGACEAFGAPSPYSLLKNRIRHLGSGGTC